MFARRVVASLTAFATAISISAIRPVVAQADPPDAAAQQIVHFLTDATGSIQDWTKGLGQVGKLADALPGVQNSPGGALGFGDLLAKAFTLSGLDTAINDATLTKDVALDYGAGDGRVGHLTSQVSTDSEGKHLKITLHISRDVLNQPLTVPVPIGTGSNAPQSAFSTEGGVKLTVSADLAFEAVYETSTGKVYLKVVDSGADATPALKVDVHGSIANVGSVKAAIGILGVSLVDDNSTSFDMNAHFVGTVSDPNDDGKLYFTNPDNSPGELAQDGSLKGLVNFGFADPAGNLTTSLHLTAAAATTFAQLPQVDATVTWDWTDISQAPPAPSLTGLSAGKFLNMTPRDLVVGIAQLVTSLTSIQQAKDGSDPSFGNLNLPFIKGSLSDAVHINEQLKAFLSDWTYPSESDPNFNHTANEHHPGPADDPAKGGEPKFVSVQEFLDHLNDTCSSGSASICVTDVHFDDATSKLDFKITLHHAAPADPIDLNAAAAAASGPATAPGHPANTTYTATGLTDPNQDWRPDEFKGRHVVAGNWAGTIATNDSDSVTLDANGWTPKPDLPPANTPYAISGMQGDVGMVELGDSLKSGGKGAGGVNAVNATAKVSPGYDAAITLVLDLQPPTVQDPPIEQHNDDGSTTVVNATPTGPDRVLLRTTGSPALFSADFPMTADADIFANAGFLQVEFKGQVKVCKTSAGQDCTGAGDPAEHMLTVGLKDNGDLTFGQVVDKLLHNPTDLLTFGVHVRATGGVDASVPGASNFFPGTAHAGFHWNDLTQFSGSDGPQFDLSGLGDLAKFDFDPSNPRALFSIILKTLQTLDSAIGDANPSGASIFNEKIPLVGRSLHDLLKADDSGAGPTVTFGPNYLVDSSRTGDAAFTTKLIGRSVVVGTQVGVVQDVPDGTKLVMAKNWDTQPATGTPYVVRSELDDAITILENSPADNLQALVQVLNDRLKDSTPLSFEYREFSGQPSLVIHLDWTRDYHTSAPFTFKLGDTQIAGAQANGSVSLGVGGEISLGLVVPLEAGGGPDLPSDLKILDNSHVSVHADASIGATVSTTFGPFTLSLGKPGGGDDATAKANYSIELAKSGAAGDPESFTDFFGDVAPTMNQTSKAVTCGLPDESDGSMALCANLPLYYSLDNTNFHPVVDPVSSGHPNSISVRLPKTGSVGDLFDLTGASIDGHPRLEVPDPGDIANLFSSVVLNFTHLDGIDSYLNLVETSLSAASFGGKLPLIGKDLQQGADFIGKLRTAMAQALQALNADHSDGDIGSDTGAIRTALNGYIGGALDDAKIPHDLLKIDTECRTKLDSVTGLTVTPGATDDGATYKYEVASYVKDASDNIHEAPPSDVAQTDNGANDLSASPNELHWDAVTDADGYHVYRDDGGTFKLLKDIPGHSTVDYTDNGSDGLGAAIDPATEQPRLHNCSATDFDSVLIVFDVTHGSFSGGDFSCPAGTFDPTNPSDPKSDDKNACIGKTVPLDIGIPGLSLRATNEGDGPSVELGYHLHLAFGLSVSDGFFVASNDVPGTPELGVGLNFKLSSGDLAAQLAFINITAHNCTDSQADQDKGCTATSPSSVKPLFNGVFSIDLKAPGGGDRLTIADLGSASLDDLFKVNLKAELAIDWLLKAKPGGGDAGFPGIQADFKMHWAWDNADPGSATGDDDHKLKIAFDNVALDTGEVFGHLLSPIVNRIKQVTGPLDPVIKTLYAPIPVLSDLSHLAGGDDVTLISIAKEFSTIAGGPDLSFVDTIAGVVNFINHFPTCTSSCLIPLGSFDLNATTALKTTATPDNTESLIDQNTKKDKDGGTAFNSIAGDIDDTNDNTDPKAADPLESNSVKAGFSFPVFEHPEKLFNLLLGGDVDLVKFDSGPLTLGFDWRQQFGPVYAPPPVVITLHGSASVTLHIVAGFDTYGIRKAFEAARAGTLDLGTVGEAFLQSLFFYTNDDNGKPIPVVSFNGEIAAGAAVTALIITVGIEGGLGLTVSFLWNDPNHDGKFRISEFLQTALNNPICLFSVSGRLYVFLKLYITVGFGPFSVSFDFTIVDVTLLDFTATPNCQPPPPKLGGLSGDGKTLVVYAAALALSSHPGGDLRGNSAYDSDGEDKDTVKITSLHDYTDAAHPTFAGVAVDMLGIRREFRNANIERVIVDGRGYQKPMSVTFIGDGKANTNPSDPSPTAQFDRDAVVFGGSGNDQIKTGIGNSWVDGGAGDDTIVTGDRTVLAADKNSYVNDSAHAEVAGGPDKDSITVGNGNDTVAGDSQLNYSTASVSLNELINDGRDGGDPNGADKGGTNSVAVVDWNNLGHPAGGTGGSDGNDPALKVGLGDSTVYGNGGNDTLSVAADSPLAATDHPHALFVSPGATLVGGDGSDHIAGGSGPDTIYTAGAVTTPIDGAGDHDAKTAGDPFGPINVVDTGTGNDTVHGGDGYDRVTGHSTHDQSDDVRGGGNDDILVGGYGSDSLYGGPGDDYVLAEPSTVNVPDGDPANYPTDGFGPKLDVTHDPLPSGTDPNHKLLVGGLGDDHIVGGDGGADVYGDQKTTPCVAGSPVASDPVDESVDDPGDGNDLITGGAGIENVRAGGGNDTADVKDNTDAVCGEKGDDTLIGGPDADQIWGGSDKDVINGDAGADKLYGNDQRDTIYGGLQADQIEGNDGADYVSGGEADDVVIGGTRDSGRPDTGDVLNGDNGADTIIGDNGDLLSGRWRPLDLDGANSAYGGKDTVYGGNQDDLGYGGLDDDTMFAGSGDDHFEGNNGGDTIFGESGEDELVGGGRFSPSAGTGQPDGVDTIWGGAQADVITGDNAVVNGNNEVAVPLADSTDVLLGRGFAKGHTVTLLDLGFSPAAGTSDGDFLHGGDATDAIFGQGGGDTVTGDDGEDYAEGGPGADTISGNGAEDDLVGGSSTKNSTSPDLGQPDAGDVIAGGDAADVVIGDNGKLLRTAAGVDTDPITDRTGMTNKRAIVLYDLSPANNPAAFGDDQVTGDDGVDVVFGQAGDDRLKGNAADDYVEGDQGSDWIEGDSGDDDLVGGSSTKQSGDDPAIVGQADLADAVYGGPGDDAVIGDNGSLLRVGERTPTFDRIGSTAAGTLIVERNLTLYDLNGPAYPSPANGGNFGDDRLSGGDGVDVVYGQDGDDQMSGGPMSDYLEGNGGADLIQGDRLLFTQPPIGGEPVTGQLNTAWPGSASAFGELEGAGADGQDDMLGGSSIANFRDGSDNIEGDGQGDFQLGDNGVLRRDIQGSAPNLTDRIFAKRYDPNGVPANAVAIRIGDPTVNPNGTTRFCTVDQATCEKAGAFGGDTMWGDGGDDTMWGQDGDDVMHGGNDRDNMYGELGDDQMWGDDGDDVMLGDRGGVVDQREDGGRDYSIDVNQVPKVHYEGFIDGTLTRATDLQHDINGDVFVGTSTDPKMPHPGDTEGGNDRMRGGNGEDFLHAGFGDDLANGDSGGDSVFGDDGADVMWGGKGCDINIDTQASSPDCYSNGQFDPAARGTNDRMVDYLVGGKGGPSSDPTDPSGDLGADIIDWHPRGALDTPGTTCATGSAPVVGGTKKDPTYLDPCVWFVMTDHAAGQTPAEDAQFSQHHQGIDWQYGGWDRDVVQGDVADNGPNAGDRLLDWNGTYNLYTHCNSAYGGYNDVRQHSPSWQAFLQQWVFSLGAGQLASDSANGTAGVGTSAFDELALVYPGGDNAHGSGSAFPSTPGHFDNPNACAP